MSADFRGTSRTVPGGNGTGKTRILEEDDEYEDESPNLSEGPEEIPPMGKFFIGFCELAWGSMSNVVQVATSSIAIMSLIVGGAAIGLTSVPDLMHKFPMYALIGMGIAGSIQLVLHMNARPIRKTMGLIRNIDNFDIRHKASWQDVGNAVTVQSLFFMAAVAGDIVSDATFINLYTHNPLVILFWIVFATGSSTIVWYDGMSRIWQAFQDWRDYRFYNRSYEDGE